MLIVPRRLVALRAGCATATASLLWSCESPLRPLLGIVRIALFAFKRDRRKSAPMLAAAAARRTPSVRTKYSLRPSAVNCGFDVVE